MTCRKVVRTAAILAAPLLLFVILLIPYSVANREFIVKWFGCGCSPDFNANDFTALFWLFITVCTTGISGFLSERIPKEKMWLRILYIAGMFAVSLLITYEFCQLMMWK